MNTRANRPLSLPLLVGGVAAILISAIATGVLTFSPGSSNSAIAATVLPDAPAAPVFANPLDRPHGCPACGVIESTREIEASADATGASAQGWSAGRSEREGQPIRLYEITVRLRDGSMRVITDAHPANWRRGERVTIIAGMD